MMNWSVLDLWIGQEGCFLVAVGQTELMTSFMRTERLSSGSKRADTSCSPARVTSETSNSMAFFSLGQLRMSLGVLSDTQKEGPFND